MAKRSSVTSYIKNLGKSLGYAAYDAIGDYTPVTKGIIEATKTTYQEAKASMKELASSGSSKAKSFTSDVLANTLDDLKTGNWYNKKRMDSDMFGDFDFDEDFGDFEDWGDDDTSSSSDSTDVITANDDANTRKVISSIGKVSGNLSKSIGYASARNAEYIVAHTRASNAALYNLNAKGFNQVSNILLNMDSTMAGIAKMGQPLNNFMENSFTFYTNTTNSLNKINESLDKLVERTAMFDPKAKKDRSVKGSYGSIFAGGMFDASAYADMVKSNIKEISEMAKGIGSMIGMMTGGLSGKNTLSLTSMIMKGGLQLMMPGMTKESLKQFDKALSNAIGRGFRQMRRAGSGNIIVDLLADIFAPKDEFKLKARTGDYEKGPVPWDGIARKALVEVIPTYLAKLNAILGGDEKYYDYEEGKFVSVESIRKKKADMINNAAMSAGGDFRADMMKSVRGNKELEEQFDNFFRSAFLNGKDFNLDKMSVESIANVFGISDKAARELKSAFKAQGYNDTRFKNNKNNYHSFLNDIHINRSDLNDRIANLAGTDNVVLMLDNGAIKELKEGEKPKAPSSAAEKLADMYNGSISVALGLVIPEYLQAIYGVLNGGETFEFNYNTGRFKTVTTTKRGYRNKVTRTASSGSGSNAGSASDEKVTAKQNDDETIYDVELAGIHAELTETEYQNYMNLPTKDQKIDYLKRTSYNNLINKGKEEVKKKVEGTGVGAKIKQALGKIKSFGDMPGAIGSMVLNSITNWLNSLFMGEKGNANKPGLFKRFGNFLNNATFNGYVSNADQIAHTNALYSTFDKLPEGTLDIIKETAGGKTIYYALTKDGEKHSVNHKVAEKFYKDHGLIRENKIKAAVNRGDLPEGTKDVIREVTDDGEEIWSAIGDPDSKGNPKRLGTVSHEVAMRFFGRKKGFWESTKEEFRKIGRNIKTSIFGEGDIKANIREYMTAAKAEMNSGSGSSLIIAGGDSGTEEKKKKEAVGSKMIADAATTAANGVKKMFMALTAGAETDKEKVFDGIKKGLKKIGDAKGAIGVGAITGAGVSLLTGAVIGPLGGAAIGAAAGLVAKSTALQDVLFGKGDPESEEYQEGILGALGKAIKGDKKGAIGGAIGAGVGGIVGQFVMGSPIVGAIVGAAGGYISQSEKAQEFLFGTPDNPKALGKLRDSLKKKFPNILVGTAAGALIGPFGIPGNLILGASMGYLTTTDRFQKFMFGDPDDPKNKHGLMGRINDIVHNLSNAIQGFVRRMGTRINDWFKKIGSSIRDNIDKALKRYAQEKADGTGLGGFLGKLAGGLATISEKGILGPVGLLQGGLRKHNLRKGNAVYDRELGRNMTALERVAYAKNNRVRNRGVYGKVDEYLATLSNEDFAGLAGLSGNDLRAKLLENGVDVKRNTQLSQIRSLITDENKLRQKNASALKEAQLADPNYSNILDIKHMLMARFKVKTDKNGNVQVDTSSTANKINAAIMGDEEMAKQRSRIARRWAAHLNRAEAESGEKSEETNKTQYTDYGPVQLVRNNQGEWVEDTSDKETAETIKKRNSFLDAVGHIPLIGAALKNGLGWLKKKLFGEEDENGEKKEGLMDKIKKWFNLDDESSWVMKFLNRAKTILKNIIPGGIAATIGIGAFTGLFDKLFENLVNILPWNKKNVTTEGTSVAGNNITTLVDDQGNIIGSAGTDASLHTAVKNNFLSRLLMGFATGGPMGSVSGGLLKFGLNGLGRIFGGKEAKWGTQLLGGLSDLGGIAQNASKSTFLASHSFNELGNNADTLIDLINSGDKAGMAAIGKADDLIGVLTGHIATGMSNLLKALKVVMPNQFATLVEKYGLQNSDDIAMDLAKVLAKNMTKNLNPAKLSKVLKNVKSGATVIAIIYAVARALQGWDTAENVLGLTRPATVGERWICALIAGLNAAIPFIGELFTDKQIVDFGLWLGELMGIDTSSIQMDRQQAIAEVDAYNQEHGTNLTVEAYNRAGYGQYGKLGTGGVFNTYGEYINTFKERKAQGGLGAAFKGIGDDIAARFNESYANSGYDDGTMGGKLRATFEGVGGVMEQILPGTVGEVNQKIMEILGAAQDGDVKGVWSATLSKFSWDAIVEKPESPFEKVIGFIAWVLGQSTIFPWKVVETIPALLKMLKNKVLDKVDPNREERSKGVIRGVELMKSNWEDFLQGAAAGKSIKELLNDTDQFDDDEENPLGGTMKAILNVQRLVFIPSVLLGRVSAKIATTFQNIVKSVKSGAEGVKRVYDDGMNMLEQGNVDIKQFFDIKAMKEDPDNPLHGIFYASAGVARLVTVPAFIMKKVSSTIKSVFDTFYYATQSAVPDMVEDDKLMRELVAKGNVRGLWNVDFTFNDSEHNMLAGIMKPINFFQRLSYTIPALFSKAGHAVVDFFKPIVDDAKDVWGNFGTYRDTVAELADEGDVRGVLMSNIVDPQDIVSTKLNPLTSIAYSTSNIIKIGGVARALFTKAGNGIKDIINSEAMESSHKAYDRAIEALNTASESGSLKQILAVKFSNATTAQSRKSPFTGFFGFGFTVVKIGSVFKQLMKNLAESFENITDQIMEIAEESPLVKLAVKTGSFFSKVAEGWGNIKENAKNEATAAYAEAGEGSRLPRGGASGFISQFDPRYQNYTIAGESFGAKGCGPAVAAMAANAMGRHMSVGQAMQYSNGYQTPDGVTIDYFQNALGSQGINTEVITGGSSQDMYNRIAAGQKMVLLGRDPSNTSKEYSPFGPNNHYVLATGVDNRGNVIINDPEGNAPKAYNPNILRNASYGVAGGGSRRHRIVGGGSRKAKAPRRTIRNLRSKYRIAGGSSLDTDVAQAVWSFFKNRGFSEPAIAGIMGNMQSESGMIPSRIQGDGTGPAAGIVQWENYNTQSGRWKAMADYAASKERDWTDLESQLEYVAMEMANPGTCYWKDETGTMTAAGVGPTTYEAFKQSTNVEQATREFEGAFERAGTPHMDARIANAANFYQLYTGKDTSDAALSSYTPIGTSALSGMTSVNGTTGGTKNGKTERKWTAGTLATNVISVFNEAFSNFFNPTTTNNETGYTDAYGNYIDTSSGYTTGGALGSSDGVSNGMANGFPYYNQKDKPWGPMRYGNYVTAEGEPATTYGAAACGPTTAAMIMKSYKAGIGADPLSAGEFAIAHGDRPPTNTGTSGTIFKHLGDANGLIVNPISKDQVVQKLGERIPVAALMGPGDFTGGGHYIAFTGTDDGHIVANDPYSTDRTSKQWSPSVINQALSLWSITDSEGKGSIRYGKVRAGDTFETPDGKTITIKTVAQDGSVYTGNMKIDKALQNAEKPVTFAIMERVIAEAYGAKEGSTGKKYTSYKEAVADGAKIEQSGAGMIKINGVLYRIEGDKVTCLESTSSTTTKPTTSTTTSPTFTSVNTRLENAILGATAGQGSGLRRRNRMSSYGDLAMAAGGSSGLLLKSRVGSRNNARPTSTPIRRVRPQRIAGGASDIADLATSYLNNAQISIANAGNTGAISSDLVTQLLSSITALLESIANNTAPVGQIYSALRAYMSAGGGSYEEESAKVTPVKTGDNGASQTDATVDANIQSLVGVLAQLAKG